MLCVVSCFSLILYIVWFNCCLFVLLCVYLFGLVVYCLCAMPFCVFVFCVVVGVVLLCVY